MLTVLFLQKIGLNNSRIEMNKNVVYYEIMYQGYLANLHAPAASGVYIAIVKVSIKS